ncbi:ketosteroid isomerase [Candidatus Marinamargulisbacteria bacterium SCGC AG-343-D04]|nr:ketosteroid isomerase [Candidatus Marinamargulisbacteria bacterium SCGC AG-343-D04]
MSSIELAENYINSLKEGDINSFFSFLSDTVIWNQPGSNSLSGKYFGKESVEKLLSEFMRRSQGTFSITDIFSIKENHGLIKIELKFYAKNDFHSIDMLGTDILRISKGKIQEVWLYSNDQESEDQFWA